jgi:hypothetical protein
VDRSAPVSRPNVVVWGDDPEWTWQLGRMLSGAAEVVVAGDGPLPVSDLLAIAPAAGLPTLLATADVLVVAAGGTVRWFGFAGDLAIPAGDAAQPPGRFSDPGWALTALRAAAALTPAAGPGEEATLLRAELARWHQVADDRGGAIEALHELNYWHESTEDRGRVIAGLEAALASWRSRAEQAEQELANRRRRGAALRSALAPVRRRWRRR